MDGYLLDANHVIPILRDKHDHRAAILQRLGTVAAESPVYIATATIAELEVGCCFSAGGRLESQAEIREVIRANGVKILDFTIHTAAEYGGLKTALMRKYNRKDFGQAAKRPEAWVHPDTGQKLGIDELDLIIISHAAERNLVLVTTDPMKRINEGIRSTEIAVRSENWVAAPGPSR